MGTSCSSILVQPEIFGGGNDPEGVGVTHSASPALHTHDGIAFIEHTELDGIHNAPLETAVNVFLPRSGLEVWLVLGEVEGIHATVQMGVSSSPRVTSDHDDGADGAIFGDQAGSCSTR